MCAFIVLLTIVNRIMYARGRLPVHAASIYDLYNRSTPHSERDVFGKILSVVNNLN